MFFLAEVLAHVALLLLIQAVGELEQLLEQLLDAAAAGVVALDQRLELLREVGAGAVQAHQPVQPGADRSLERLDLGVLVLRRLEALRQSLEIDLGEVDGRRPEPRSTILLTPTKWSATGWPETSQAGFSFEMAD